MHHEKESLRDELVTGLYLFENTILDHKVYEKKNLDRDDD